VFFKKSVYLLVLGIVFSLLLVQFNAAVGDEDKNIRELVAELQVVLRENRDAGKDISAAIGLDRRSREAFMAGRHEEARRLLKEAISLLKGGTIEDLEDKKRGLRELSTDKKELQTKGVKIKVWGYEDSPFGIHDPNIIRRPLLQAGIKPPGFDEPKDLADLGVKWVRYAGATGINWGMVEREKGVYDWAKTDFMYGETYKNNLKMIVTVSVFNRLDRGISDKVRISRSEKGYFPKNMDWYLDFLKKTVERYDGDGIKDAPGSPVVDVWQIENELDTPGGWSDTIENYVHLLKESYKTIKKVNPQARVAIAGMATTKGFSLYSKILKYLRPDEKYFDIFDLHWSGQFMGS